MNRKSFKYSPGSHFISTSFFYINELVFKFRPTPLHYGNGTSDIVGSWENCTVLAQVLQGCACPPYSARLIVTSQPVYLRSTDSVRHLYLNQTFVIQYFPNFPTALSRAALEFRYKNSYDVRTHCGHIRRMT